METIKRSKTIAIVATTVLIAAVVWLVNLNSTNGSLRRGIEKEKLNAESLLSEKLLLEKDLQKAGDQLATLSAKNTSLDEAVKRADATLTENARAVERLKKENAGVAQLKRERQELHSIESQLRNELQTLRYANAALEQQNNQLNQTVTSLQERNRLLSDDLNKAMFSSLDQSQIQAVRGKSQRLTLNAKRVRKLTADFEIPMAMKDIRFNVIDEDGKVLTDKDGSVTYSVLSLTKNFTASAKTGTGANSFQKIEMVYTPKEKLKAGVYIVEVLHENLHVGSLKIKLL